MQHEAVMMTALGGTDLGMRLSNLQDKVGK